MSTNISNYLESIKTLQDSEYYQCIGMRPEELIRIHQSTSTWEYVHKGTISTFLGKPGEKDSYWKVYPARTEYRPDLGVYKYQSSEQLFTILNSYRPPIFLLDYFWKGQADAHTIEQRFIELDEWSKLLPKPHLDFFTHLCNDDKESLSYLMDWLSFAVNPSTRNLTTLVLIAKQGIGKGVFFDSILEPLFGATNVVMVKGQDSLRSRFNAPYMNKRLIFFDEAVVKDDEVINRLKSFANSMLEIEQKGKDPIYVKNWANTCLASNDLNSLRIDSDDRRFSIIDTTDKRLDVMVEEKGYGNVEALRLRLADIGNIKSLHYLLMTHKPTRNMNYTFTTNKKTAKIKEASLHSWQLFTLEYLTELYKKNTKRISLKQLQDKILTENEGLRAAPGRIQIEALLKDYPHVGCIRRDRTYKRFVKIIGEYASADSYDVEDESITEETVVNTNLIKLKGP